MAARGHDCCSCAAVRSSGYVVNSVALPRSVRYLGIRLSDSSSRSSVRIQLQTEQASSFCIPRVHNTSMCMHVPRHRPTDRDDRDWLPDDSIRLCSRDVHANPGQRVRAQRRFLFVLQTWSLGGTVSMHTSNGCRLQHVRCALLVIRLPIGLSYESLGVGRGYECMALHLQAGRGHPSIRSSTAETFE